MANLVTTYTFDAVKVLLRVYLGLPAGDDPDVDPFLEGWLSGAVECGDQYLGNDFVDPDTGTDIPHPPAIRQGVFEWIRVMWRLYKTNASPGVTNVKTGDLSQGFNASGGSGRVQPMVAAKDAAIPFWCPSREGIWR